MEKIYGNEKTNLVLTEKAEKVYAETEPLTIIEHEDGLYSINGCIEADELTAEEVNEILEDLSDDFEEPEDDIVLKISRIDTRIETFCTPWDAANFRNDGDNISLYCVDVIEDAEERDAWLYRAGCGVKMHIFGEKVSNDRDVFLNIVFSNLPDDIKSYEKDIERLEESYESEVE